MEFVTENRNEEKIKLTLKRNRNGQVILEGIDDTGKVRAIMGFRDGKFYRYNCSALQGIETVQNGAIEEAMEEWI